jgi:hypothetical protein
MYYKRIKKAFVLVFLLALNCLLLFPTSTQEAIKLIMSYWEEESG